MIGSPTAIGLIATLWPAGIRSAVVTPSATTMPGGRLERAISTPSSGCRRMTGAGVIWVPPQGWRAASGELNDPLLATPYSCLRFLRLAGGILPGLVHLHLGVGHHQPALVRQRHQLEAHVDRSHRALGAGAVDAGMKAALAALLDDLLIDLEDFRFVAVELRHQAVGEAEVGGADIDAVDALDVEDRFHVLDRGLGLHHRQQNDLVVGGLLVAAGRAVHARTDRAV